MNGHFRLLSDGCSQVLRAAIVERNQRGMQEDLKTLRKKFACGRHAHHYKHRVFIENKDSQLWYFDHVDMCALHTSVLSFLLFSFFFEGN